MKTFMKLLGAAAIVGGVLYACNKWMENHPKHTRIQPEDIPEVDDDWDDYTIEVEPEEEDAECSQACEAADETTEDL